MGFGQKRSTAGVTLDSGTRIDGEMQSTVDVKKARVGDQVVLKTKNAIKQNGQTVVPKGSNLVGRITEVQQRSKSNTQSRLGLVFDRIEGKNLSAPISASIVSITGAAAHTSAGDADADVFGSSGTLSNTSTTSSGSGGGLLGGVGNTVGGVLNTTTQTVGGVADSAVRTVGNTTSSVGRAVSGIQISNSASGSASAGSTLSASDRDIKLDKGATLQLQLNSTVRAQ